MTEAITRDFFVLLDANDVPVAIDGMSGGYPYPASHPQHMAWFGSEADALKYKRVAGAGHSCPAPWRMVKAKVVFEELPK